MGDDDEAGGEEMADTVMILISIAFFVLAFALVKWFDLI